MPNGEFYNQTTLHPVAIVVLLLLSAGLWIVPRRFALVPLLILALSVGPAQRVVFATLDFTFLRVLIAVGWTRILIRSETAGFQWKTLDTVLVAWSVCALVTSSALHGTVSEAIYESGILYDAIGTYFLCRFLVRDWEDIVSFSRCAAIISFPVAIAFLIEMATARNMFATFGGVPAITVERFGRLRCQGPFQHPILAGCFWIVLMPLMSALWWQGHWSRVLAYIGVTASIVVVITCASSTPLSGLIFGCIAAISFVIRRWMWCIRWGTVLMLLALQMVMEHSVWHLIARVDIVAGSTSWYRYKLIDSFINHFSDWWKVGSTSYVGWWEWGLDDITNQYVAQGLEGGASRLLLFLALIVVGFYGVGKSWRSEDRRRRGVVLVSRGPSVLSEDRRARSSARIAMAWALGVALFMHCVVFFGVSYFGQASMGWYLTLGLIGSMSPTGVLRRGSIIRIRRPRPIRQSALAGAPA